jgi:hypothetical protein
MDKFTYYSISGTYKETNIPVKNPQDMLNYIEHFTSDDPIDDNLLMVYKTTNVKIIEKDEAKKLIEKYL